MATHDFLLSNQLSLAAEYETPEGKAARPRFFCFSREKPVEAVRVQSAGTISEIEDNPILQEFADHYDREQELFVGEGKRGK